MSKNNLQYLHANKNSIYDKEIFVGFGDPLF